jgi:hypothetical protein
MPTLQNEGGQGFFYTPYDFASAYDPVTGHVFIETTTAFLEYDHEANTLTRLSDLYFDGGRWGTRNGIIIPDRRIFLSVQEGTIRVYQLSDGSHEEWEFTGDTGVLSASAPGMGYHPPSGRVYAWGSGGEIFQIDLDGRRVTGTGVSFDPPEGVGWTWGRFRYVPRDGVFIAVGRANEDIAIYKPPQ